MQKFIGLVFCIFLVLVGFNYLSHLAGNFLSYGLPFGAVRADQRGGNQRISQGYGRTSFASAYRNAWHNGIDITAAYGAPVYSPGEGVVIATGNQDDYCPRRGFGRYIAVEDSANGLVLWYAHLGKIDVSPGKTVKKGTLIANVGTSGFETGPHLHFSIFDARGFSIEPRNGCGPDAMGIDLNPLSYLGSVYQ